MLSKTRSRLFLLTAAILLLGSAAILIPLPSSGHVRAEAAPTGLHVVGNQLEDGSGRVIVPRGVDRMGTEYQCTKGGMTPATDFDGNSDQASISAMLTWGINSVRLPLNEDCWLGINGFPANGKTAAQYQADIVSFVNLLNQNGLIVILDLHWNNSGSNQATGQEPMPDLDHAPAFWTSVSNTFKTNSSVIFDLYNEPFTTSWSCWKNGSTAAQASPCADVGFAVAGMQTLVNAVRATGATNVLMLGGLAYANDLSQWLANKPADPLNNIAASLHAYNFNNCSNPGCWSAQVAPVKAQVPVIAGEIGENDCASGFVTTLMNWFDGQGIGYLAWTWTATGSCGGTPSLIADYTGTPTNYGAGVKAHLLSLSGSGWAPSPISTTTPTGTPQISPTGTPQLSPTGTQTATPTTGGSMQNPYAGAQGFLNPNYVAEVKAGAASVGGALGEQEAQVAQYPTAIWLDSRASVTGGTGYPTSLLGYLQDAETQARSSSQPIVMTIVIYDLPDRDCAALASNGELQIASNGLQTYEHSYIDVIASDLSQPQFSNLRISAIIEPDSLPNLVTNLSIAKCAQANSSGVYVQGIQYALNKLHAIPNVYNFLDIAHAGWLGWTSNFQPFVTLVTNVIKGTTAGLTSVDGFISNTANYTPITEPYMTANQQINGQPVRSATFFQWDTSIDEQTYDTDMRNAFIAAGFPNTIGMLIDTSRNGWGGPKRPSGPSTSTDLNTFVNTTRIDQRIAWGDWCNQPGGIGARPVANPAPGIFAFVWIKPPGESDGSSSLIPTGANNPTGKGFDQMCDPSFGGDPLNNNMPTGAMPNAPVSGAWFQAGFNLLVQNAYPPFP